MFQVGDVVTFKETDPLWDANACLITYLGNLVEDGYMKRNRPWLVMDVVPEEASGEDEPLCIVCPIAKDPTRFENLQGLELQDGTLGFVAHTGKSEDSEEPNRFMYPLATLVREAGTEYWRDFSKSPKARKRHLNVAKHPDWPALHKAFWGKWNGRGPMLLVKCFREKFGGKG